MIASFINHGWLLGLRAITCTDNYYRMPAHVLLWITEKSAARNDTHVCWQPSISNDVPPTHLPPPPAHQFGSPHQHSRLLNHDLGGRGNGCDVACSRFDIAVNKGSSVNSRLLGNKKHGNVWIELRCTGVDADKNEIGLLDRSLYAVKKKRLWPCAFLTTSTRPGS